MRQLPGPNPQGSYSTIRRRQQPHAPLRKSWDEQHISPLMLMPYASWDRQRGLEEPCEPAEGEVSIGRLGLQKAHINSGFKDEQKEQDTV